MITTRLEKLLYKWRASLEIMALHRSLRVSKFPRMSTTSEQVDEVQKVAAAPATDIEHGESKLTSTNVDKALDFLNMEEQPEPLSPEAQKALVRKIDWMLIPLLGGVYLLNYLDKVLLNFAGVMVGCVTSEGNFFSLIAFLAEHQARREHHNRAVWQTRPGLLCSILVLRTASRVAHAETSHGKVPWGHGDALGCRRYRHMRRFELSWLGSHSRAFGHVRVCHGTSVNLNHKHVVYPPRATVSQCMSCMSFKFYFRYLNNIFRASGIVVQGWAESSGL